MALRYWEIGATGEASQGGLLRSDNVQELMADLHVDD